MYMFIINLYIYIYVYVEILWLKSHDNNITDDVHTCGLHHGVSFGCHFFPTFRPACHEGLVLDESNQ